MTYGPLLIGEPSPFPRGTEISEEEMNACFRESNKQLDIILRKDRNSIPKWVVRSPSDEGITTEHVFENLDQAASFCRDMAV